jgi:hypothetical protein
MADLKISQLTGATTPLAGTEVLPIVQSSTTKKVSVSDLTAGREVSASKFIPTGNVVTGTGMYLPTSNELALSINGGESLRLTSTGLGIGVTNPNVRLEASFTAGSPSLSNYSGVGLSLASSSTVKVNIGTYSSGSFGGFIQATNNNGTGFDLILNPLQGNVNVGSGNLVIGTAGKGLDFSGNGNVLWRCGADTPEGAVTAPVGSLYTRTDGGAGTTLYVKESGAGNTGWVAK